MNYYLSSYKLGNQTDELKRLVPNKKIGYIPNALDFTKADPERRKKHIEKDTQALHDLGLVVEIVDLREYFGNQSELQRKLIELGAIFISGGNVFVLRQAMKLSGLDYILMTFQKDSTAFLYAGYSAACCVLSEDLHAYAIVDDATDMPYAEQKEVIWKGLGIINYAFLPHWDSDHPESEDIDKEIIFCQENGIPYKAIRDGEVVILE